MKVRWHQLKNQFAKVSFVHLAHLGTIPVNHLQAYPPDRHFEDGTELSAADNRKSEQAKRELFTLEP
jgi:hypothetical protein